VTTAPAPPDAPTETAAFRVERVDDETGWTGLRFAGELRFADAAALWSEVERLLAEQPPDEVLNLDVSHVDRIEGGAMALLVDLRARHHARGIRSEIVGARGSVEQILELYGGDAPPATRPRPTPPSLLEQIGAGTVEALEAVKQVLGFAGTMVLECLAVARAPRTANWRDTLPIMSRSGADAVPIVLLTTFLLGFVMAFQSAAQLKLFGANIYVADLVGLSVTRELGPLMTAIVVCGRSGAAFAAELGTMKVSEEIDALRTLGFGPLRFLVFPRVLALLLVLPLLTLLADVVAIIGGLAVAVTSLDLSMTAFLTEIRAAVGPWDVTQGLIKSVVFAAAIGLISCQQGLATSGGAEGVGRRTTSSVVSILFALILIDALFAVVFHVMEL
jgi:phospholipid/cholesterol/gamma-HCH transport system permease protein